MRESVRMVVVLTAIAVISAGVLSVVYSYTNEIIQANLTREIEAAVFEVIPNVEAVNTLEAGVASLVEDDRSTLRERAGTEMLLFEGLDETGEAVGFAFIGEGNGYAGVIKVLVGVGLNQQITGIKIIEHLETPGLGDRIERAAFLDQFIGKGPDADIRIGGEIDNISGATVSAVAVAEAVKNHFADAIASYEGGR